MEAILNSLPVGVYRATRSGRILAANVHLAEMLAVESLAALLASNAFDYYASPEIRARSLNGVDKPGETARFEAVFKRRDGSTFWGEVFAKRVDDEPDPTYVGLVTDITDRKRLEADVERFSHAAAKAGEVVFMTDPMGIFTYLNPEFTRVYGYEAHELIGRHTPRVLKSGRQSDEQYRDFWQQLLEGRGVRSEFTNRCKDGRLVLVDGSANPILDEHGSINGFLAIQRDITERRRTEDALHESEALFRRIFDQLPVGAALLSTGGRFHRANAAFCQMFGWSEAELQQMTAADITHAEERERTRQITSDLISGQVEKADLEKRYVRKDGSVIWGAVSVRLIRDAAGRSLWTMPVVIDVTERRRLEEQLRQSQKMEAVGQLAGGIAHDFNNILTAMLGFCELALANDETPESVASDLHQIHMGGQRAAALTRQLLAFSRKQVLRLEAVDLSQVLGGFQRLVRPIIGEDIELALDLPPSPAPVLADVAQLEQVAMNLVVNARDAMPHGGVIRIRTANVLVDAEAARFHDFAMPPGDYVELAVEDTGHGMDAETKRRVFEPFFTTKPPGEGTGLGLAVVYGIVKQMGGFIWVYSEVGQGTTFKIHFPRAERQSADRADRSVDVDSAGRGERVLLVEDDREVRAYAARVLQRQGYQVIEAGSGIEALEQLAEMAAPDLVISDMVMPGISGPDFVRQVTARYPDIKFIFMSGYLDHRLVASLGEDVELLEKPFTPAALLRRVRTTLDRSESSE
jgi:PAS domain S-box-containing protein